MVVSLNSFYKMLIPPTMSKITANTLKIEGLLKSVGDEVNEISSALGEIFRRMKESRMAELKQENEKLEQQIEASIRELRDIRRAIGIPEVSISTVKSSESSISSAVTPDSETKVATANKSENDNVPHESKNQKAAKEEKVAKPEEPDFGRLDIRVGKIKEVEKHPNADSLYVEVVDVGEEKTRTIISGLVKHVAADDLRGKLALFLVNLKPAKIRGIESQGMIMCANLSGKVEVLVPPEGVKPGDIVTVDGYERKPDTMLNPKRKIFEHVQVDLKTNDKREATYKGKPWSVSGLGPAVAPTLSGALIK